MDVSGKKPLLEYAQRVIPRTPKIVLWTGLLVVLTGCCTHRFTKPAQALTEPQSVMDGVKKRAALLKSFEFNTRVAHYGETGVFKGAVDVLGHRPAQLRFEVLSPTDDTLAVVVSDGKRFMSHERGRPRCLVGPACAANVSRLLPIAFEGSALFDLLTGGTSFLTHDQADVTWDECEGALRLTLRRAADDTVQTVWLSPHSFVTAKMRVVRKKKELFVLEYDDFRTIDGVEVPFSIRLTSEHRGTDLSIDLREAYINQTKPGALFEPTCPQGTQEEEVPCP